MSRAVKLQSHDPAWASEADFEIDRIRAVTSYIRPSIYHIGSTAVPGLMAKPIVDLLGVVDSAEQLDAIRPAIESLGYKWRGENGIPGRRYSTLDDPNRCVRTVHLHFHASGDPAIDLHLSFLNILLREPQIARDYEHVKSACAAAHPDDSAAYTQCKAEWMRKVATRR